MVISGVLKIGQVIYRIARFQEKAIGHAYRFYPKPIRQGVVHGSTIGTIAGGVIEFFKGEEESGNIDGIQTGIQKRHDNRQRQTRGTFQRFVGNRGKRKKYNNRCRPKYSRYSR